MAVDHFNPTYNWMNSATALGIVKGYLQHPSEAVKPRFEEWSNGSSVLYVLSKNLHRRHLTTSQRAAIAAEAVPMLREEAQKRQATSGPGVYGGEPLPEKSTEAVSSTRFSKIQKGKGDTREIAAKQVCRRRSGEAYARPQATRWASARGGDP